MEKSIPPLAALNLITRIRLLWINWLRRPRERIAANAVSHAARSENFAGRWPDAAAVLAWRLSATAVSNPPKRESGGSIGKQETL